MPAERDRTLGHLPDPIDDQLLHQTAQHLPQLTGGTVNLTNLARSYVRTVVPVVVGLVVSLALRAGVDLNGWTPEITAAVTFLYYALARYLEEHVSGQFGWLLGSATPPRYPAKAHR